MASEFVEFSQLEKGLPVNPSPADQGFVQQPTTSTGSTTLADVNFSSASARLRCWYTSTLRRVKASSLSWTRRKSAHPPRLHVHGRMSPTKIQKIENFPKGFPKLARFLDSDDNFMVYRRFGTVCSRLLLYKQDEISKMEGVLHSMDKMDERAKNGKYLMSRALDVERDGIPEFWPESRPQLMEKLEKKIVEYAELLLKCRDLKALNQPPARDYRSVRRFMENEGGQLYQEESEFIYLKEDLVTLRPGREYAWLDGAIEHLLQIFRCRILRYVFVSKDTKEKTDDKRINYFDRDRIGTCVTLIITAIVLALLMIPIYLLYRLSLEGTITQSPKTVGLILVPTLIFSAILSAFTKAKRHEILAASAGYCAVLVVFLGNVSGGTRT